MIDKNAHARGHERGCKLGLSFFCFLEEINNLSSTFFKKKKKKQTHRQQVACHLYNEKQKLIPL